jgi:hypothetical protein
MVTKEQALTADRFHITLHGDCKRVIGPRGGVKETIRECRRSGRTQVWKTRPEDFRVPVKYGMYESGEITRVNAAGFHVPEDCPIIRILEPWPV